MATFRNTSTGLRGVVLRSGERAWIEAGETLVMARAAVIRLPDGVEEVGDDAMPPPPSNPLDHDGDGVKGGSLPGEQSTASKGRRRKTNAPA